MTKRTRRTRHVVMGLLLSGPKSGYTIKKIIEQSIIHFWTESLGQIYPVLRELAQDGLIEQVESPPREGGRPTKVYALTELGRMELEDWLAKPPWKRPPRNELLLKLFFMPRVDPTLALEHVSRFKAEAEAELEELDTIRRRLAEEHGEDREYAFWLATLLYGIREAEAHLSWCDEVTMILKD
jgi:PadR family transcriptional regulator AphA